jgi:predicted nucleotidyltransferase
LRREGQWKELKRYLSSSEARYLKINFDEILDKLRGYAKSKAKDQHARAIVLTGSFARGSYTGSSDADILVIADNVPANVLERYALFSDPEFPIDLEPRVYATKEFVKMICQGNRFALNPSNLVYRFMVRDSSVTSGNCSTNRQTT